MRGALYRQRIVLERRLGALLTPDNFRVVREKVPHLKPDQLLVRNTMLSVDPFTRGRLGAQDSYVTGIKIQDVIASPGVGVVEESLAKGIPPGTRVYHEHGWETMSVVDLKEATILTDSDLRDEYYLGALGIPGFCAWIAVHIILEVNSKDTVLIPSATGAVGTLAVQLAARAGAKRVICGCHSLSHLELLRDIGADFVYSATTQALPAVVKELGVSPNKIIDSVGGRQLESILSLASIGAKIATIGSMGATNEAGIPNGVRNLSNLVTRSLTLQGFTLDAYAHRRKEFVDDVSSAIKGGGVNPVTVSVEGFDNVIPAFMSLFARGQHFGKLLVHLPAEV